MPLLSLLSHSLQMYAEKCEHYRLLTEKYQEIVQRLGLEERIEVFFY